LVLEISGQKKMYLSCPEEFGHFRPKESGFGPSWGNLDISGLKNNDLGPRWGIWTFQALRIRIWALVGDFVNFRLKE
jgi:hypothetical protein